MLNKIKLYEELLYDAGKFIKDKKNLYLSRDSYEIIRGQVKSLADLAVNEILVSGIRKISRCPVILSEENKISFSSHMIKSVEECFVIDPIDGTASYVGGFPGYVIQIAYIRKGVPIFSLVYSPENEAMFFARRKEGAYLNGIKISVKPVQKKIVFIDNTPVSNPELTEIMKKFKQSCYVECGSIGLKICKIASGDADVFYKNVLLRDWDLIPPALILEEAGGFMLSLAGVEMNYFLNNDFAHEGLIASSSLTYVRDIINCDGKYDK